MDLAPISILEESSEEQRLMEEYFGCTSDSEPRPIKEEFMEFCFNTIRTPRNLLNFDVVKFWEQRKIMQEFPRMHKLASVVFSASFTQVHVERTFSVFALVLTHLRNRLSDENLNSLIATRGNLDLVSNMDFLY